MKKKGFLAVLGLPAKGPPPSERRMSVKAETKGKAMADEAMADEVMADEAMADEEGEYESDLVEDEIGEEEVALGREAIAAVKSGDGAAMFRALRGIVAACGLE